jgi:hypothetical protein
VDGLALLKRARDAGLRVEAAGDKLLIRGPKQAEPIVKLLAEHKAEVVAALTPETNEARRWRERFTARTFEWYGGKREWQKAKELAWGEILNEWHALHGRRWPAWECAGCGKLIGGLEALNLPDGNRVHFEPIDCLIGFGRRWRSDAQGALIAFGLEVPTGEESGS